MFHDAFTPQTDARETRLRVFDTHVALARGAVIRGFTALTADDWTSRSMT
jgi:hypothetical protein